MKTVVQTKSGNFVVVNGDRPVSRPYLNYCSLLWREEKKSYYIHTQSLMQYYKENFSEAYFEGYDRGHDAGIKDPEFIAIINSGVLNA